jgi:primosomal protein N' (replication factor Y)
VILFQNQGYSPIIECILVVVPQCQQCDVSLTYHKHKINCVVIIADLPWLNLHTKLVLVLIDYKGFGTEQIEQELVTIFPTQKLGGWIRIQLEVNLVSKIIDSFKIGKWMF